MPTQTDPDFTWVPFYEEFADKLAGYRDIDRRPQLIAGLKQAFDAVGSTASLDEEYKDGIKRPFRDMDPFTVTGSFNRGTNTRESTREAMAGVWSDLLQIQSNTPKKFDGLSVAFIMNWRYFPDPKNNRRENDIELLWDLFASALELAKNPEFDGLQATFKDSFDKVMNVRGIGIAKLTIGLFWIRPQFYVALDYNNLSYILKHLPHPLASKATQGDLSGAEYLELLTYIRDKLSEPGAAVDSIPRLSFEAWQESGEDDELTRIGEELAEKGEFTPRNEPDARDKIDSSIARRRGQPEFRSKLLEAYGKRCAITGCDAVEALEAAHIRQYKEADLNDVTNRLLLRADIHTLFDRHLIGIDPAGKVWIGEQLEGTQYAELKNTEARRPKKIKDNPDPDALREHSGKAKELGRF